MRPSLRLAVGQSPADLAGTQARLAWLQSVLPEVATAGAKLLLLPELFACGYNIGDAITERAEALDGPTAIAVAEMARDHAVAIVYSFAERCEGEIYSAALCITPDGAPLGHHRKLVIPPGFERDHFTAGRGCQLFEYCGLKIAILICYDAEFAETVRHVAGQGAELVLVPTALGAQWGWVAQTMIPTRAYENGIYLAYANSAGTERGFAFLGQSVVAAPDGQEAARAGAESDILLADIHLERVTAAQARLPYLQDRALLKFT